MKKDYASAFLFGMLTIVLLDGIWLGIIQRKAWVSQIALIQGSSSIGGGGGGFSSKKLLLRTCSSAIISYMLLLFGILALAVSRVRDPDENLRGTCGDALLWGSVLGVVVYGVYDFTTLALLKNYTIFTAVGDFCWGIVLCATTTLVSSLAANFVPIL